MGSFLYLAPIVAIPIVPVADSAIAFPVVIVSADVLLIDVVDLLYGPFTTRLIVIFCF